MMDGIQPNPGHYALAALEDLLPQVVIVTQNIDGLHRMAGSTDIIPLHGNIHQHKCFANCQGDPTLIDIDTLAWDQEAGPPECPHCGSWVRPDVVWFNEALPRAELDRAMTLSKNADVMLVVGTSGVVQPAASLPYYARRYNDAYVIDVNPTPSEITPIAQLFLEGPSGEILTQVVGAMRDTL
jgi:NAD-dependent deacetylase